MALAEVLQLDDTPTPIALATEPAATDASPQDWRLHLSGKPPRIITNGVTPTDELTGLPLLIAGFDESDFDGSIEGAATEHHGWHPSNDPLFGTLAGVALRNSFKEIVPARFHNFGKQSYHAQLGGPRLITNGDNIFASIVMACAGAIPTRVVDLSGSVPVERDMTVEEWQFFNAPDERNRFGRRYVRYSYEPIREFFREYVLKQEVDKEHEELVHEFLSDHPERDKRYLGHLLLAKSAELVSKRINKRYSILRRAGILHTLMPNSSQTLVKYKLGNPAQRESLLPQLQETLQARLNFEAVD